MHQFSSMFLQVNKQWTVYFASSFSDPESSANLFFNFADIRDSLQDAATKQGSSFYYLFENTSSMDPCNRDFISGRLDAEPIEKDALDFTGMRRKRLFWSGYHHNNSFAPMKVLHKLQWLLCISQYPSRGGY